MTFQGFRICSYGSSARVAGELSIASIFKANAEVSERAFFLEAVADAGDYRETKAEGKIIGLRRGYGLRVSVLVKNVEVASSLNFAAIAASAELNKGSVQYEVDGLGISIEVIKDLLAVAVRGTLDLNAYGALTEVLEKKLPEHIKANPGQIAPVEYRVPRISLFGGKPIERGMSINYAMNRINDGLTLPDALDRAGRDLDQEIIRFVYWRVLRESNWDTRTPDAEDRQQAAGWLGGTWSI